MGTEWPPINLNALRLVIDDMHQDSEEFCGPELRQLVAGYVNRLRAALPVCIHCRQSVVFTGTCYCDSCFQALLDGRCSKPPCEHESKKIIEPYADFRGTEALKP